MRNNVSSSKQAVAEVQEMVQACMQCGTCTASCPNSFAMDLSPRAMWRMITMGFVDDVTKSKTYWLCSNCYNCTLRCPRGLKLTAAIQALKRIAVRDHWPMSRSNGMFYQKFMDSVRQHGRVRETELMMNYFIGMRQPLLPLKFAGVSLKLLRRGKLHPTLPLPRGKGKLDKLFAKARQLEERS